MSQNNKRNWKVVYSNYSGPEKKAAEPLNKAVKPANKTKAVKKK